MDVDVDIKPCTIRVAEYTSASNLKTLSGVWTHSSFTAARTNSHRVSA